VTPWVSQDSGYWPARRRAMVTKEDIDIGPKHIHHSRSSERSRELRVFDHNQCRLRQVSGKLCTLQQKNGTGSGMRRSWSRQSHLQRSKPVEFQFCWTSERLLEMIGHIIVFALSFCPLLISQWRCDIDAATRRAGPSC
jgi:hypothetical protein